MKTGPGFWRLVLHGRLDVECEIKYNLPRLRSCIRLVSIVYVAILHRRIFALLREYGLRVGELKGSSSYA
jgi:hypothetical protein